MREIRCAVVDLDHYLEEAARAKDQLDAEHWRGNLRPRALRLFEARITLVKAPAGQPAPGVG